MEKSRFYNKHLMDGGYPNSAMKYVEESSERLSGKRRGRYHE